MASLDILERRSDLDWLRVIAFMLLIYFHAAIAFVPGGIPMIQNETTSPVLEVAVAFLHEFRLALLFLISGVGVAFAQKHRNRGEFLRERSRRLLIPFAFGVLALVPPMVFLEKRFVGAFEGSFWSFYPRFFTCGVYPGGNLSWHHFWFIAYLYLFCLLGLPVFARLRAETGRRLLGVLAREGVKGARLYWPIAPLAVVEVSLRAFFPGFRDLIHDGASFTQWFLVFIAGFVFASCRPLLDRAQSLRAVSLISAVIATSTLFVVYWSPEHGGFSPGDRANTTVAEYVVFCLVRVANLWLWLLTLLGYAGRYLRRRSAVLEYLNEAVYPLFCLHLMLIVALGYLIVPFPFGLWGKYLVITTGTVVVALGFHHFVIRRVAWLRPLFGLRPRASVGTRRHAPLARSTDGIFAR